MDMYKELLGILVREYLSFHVLAPCFEVSDFFFLLICLDEASGIGEGSASCLEIS